MLRPFSVYQPFRNQWPAVFGGKSLAQQIAALFANDEQGAVYDPSDLSTLYSEWEGTLTTQSTVGGVVGTMLDKSRRDNHAQAPSDAARPLLGREPEGGVRNLLLNTEVISNWVAVRATAIDNQVDPNGGTDAALIKETNVVGSKIVAQSSASSLPANATCVVRCIVKDLAGNRFFQFFLNDSSSENRGLAAINPRTGEVLRSTEETISAESENLGGGWYSFAVTFTSAETTLNFQLRLANSLTVSAASYVGVSDNGIYAYAPQLEAGSTPTPYQRVGASSLDVTEAGKRDCFYLFHDLDDDKLQVTLPDLGSNVTIATGDNDGVTILTGQTVGAGVYDLPDAKSKLFGHLIIDRALTAKETETLTEFLEQKVSVP
jgi:hypothetical protein